MKYQAAQRLRLAWHWLPVEILIVFICVAGGWGLSTIMSKPVYHGQVDIKITRRLSKHASSKQRAHQQKQDIENVGQFSVMPHQSGVLYQASEYAYTHFGIWQPVQDLSESVTAEPVKDEPVLRVVAASSSRAIATENSRAFTAAIKQSLKALPHYRVTVTQRTTTRDLHIMRKPMLEFMTVVGLGVAAVTPYAVEYVRGRGAQSGCLNE